MYHRHSSLHVLGLCTMMLVTEKSSNLICFQSWQGNSLLLWTLLFSWKIGSLQLVPVIHPATWRKKKTKLTDDPESSGATVHVLTCWLVKQTCLVFMWIEGYPLNATCRKQGLIRGLLRENEWLKTLNKALFPGGGTLKEIPSLPFSRLKSDQTTIHSCRRNGSRGWWMSRKLHRRWSMRR